MNEQGLIAEVERLRKAVFHIEQRLHARRNLCFNARCQRDAALGFMREIQHQRDVTESEIIRLREAARPTLCRKRMPNEYDIVLGMYDDKHFELAWWQGTNGSPVWYGTDGDETDPPTYWLALPEPPEGEQ